MLQQSLLGLFVSTSLLSKPLLAPNGIEAAIYSVQDPEPSLFQRMAMKFLMDPVANSLAVIVLIGMIISVIWLSWAFVSDFQGRLPTWKPWGIPLLALIGLGVAFYLSYVEVTASNAICGPVGNCNSVQQSPYARLFGLIPVGLLGMIGYTAILIAWGLGQRSPGMLGKYIPIAIWVMAWLGTIFSIYLTFLEPFVIGATCMWCLSSAVIMTIILWLSTSSAKGALNIEE